MSNLDYKRLSEEFINYMQELNYKVYDYKSQGEIKIFHKNAYLAFEKNNLYMIIFEGNENSIRELKAIVKGFLAQKNLPYCYMGNDESRMIVGQSEYKSMSDDEILDYFRSVYG